MITFSFLLFSFIFVMIFQNCSLYRTNVFLTMSRDFVAIGKAFLIGIPSIITISFVLKFQMVMSFRILVLSFFVVALISVSIARLTFLRTYYINFSKTLNASRFLFIGSGHPARLLVEKLTVDNFYGITVVGFLDDDIPVGDKVIGDLKCKQDLDYWGYGRLPKKLSIFQKLRST